MYNYILNIRKVWTNEWVQEVQITAENEAELYSVVRKKGCEVIEVLESSEVVKWPFQKFKDYIEANFESSWRFDPETTNRILKMFAEWVEDWLHPRDALRNAKAMFWKGDKKVLSAIDDLINAYEKPWVKNFYDVVRLKEELFEPEFIELMRVTQNTELSYGKLISNEVEWKNKREEIWWYVQLSEANVSLMKDLKSSIIPPLVKFAWLFGALMLILVFVLQKVIDAVSNMRDVSQDSYLWIWEVAIWTSNFMIEYWIYIGVVVFGLLLTFFITYTNNEIFRESVQRYFLKMWLVWEILEVMYTRKVASLMWIFFEAWVRNNEMLNMIASTISNIPLKKELEYIASESRSQQFKSIFKSYPAEDKNLSEIFYTLLARESDPTNPEGGRYWKAYAIVLNTMETRWDVSISKYPVRIWKIINFTGLFIVWFYLLWAIFIMLSSIMGSL